ncbi:hypothetical protein L484_026378 [Morus notabilis]|uniref:EIF3F/CSN6-like C-terminal domain-containing protein n=1 Tax=Morus notabilis TaxID=981085 RepID=W9QY95_9ROSA|nr:hypothetical protein L484_026378 [Morus notabilis]
MDRLRNEVIRSKVGVVPIEDKVRKGRLRWFGPVDILKTTAVDKIPTDLEGMEASMERLLALIDDVSRYVDNVVEGNIAPDNNIGRFISDTLASVPKLSPMAFDKLLNDSLQDHLLLLYLSSITRTQLSLAEKLNTAAQIL